MNTKDKVYKLMVSAVFIPTNIEVDNILILLEDIPSTYQYLQNNEIICYLNYHKTNKQTNKVKQKLKTKTKKQNRAVVVMTKVRIPLMTRCTQKIFM